MKVYCVFYKTGAWEPPSLERIFSTLEKAKAYIRGREESYRDSYRISERTVDEDNSIWWKDIKAEEKGGSHGL